ncbi:MAG: AbrB/MazE/SpoVT family DNA-binding domain-containing protein [Candidatus Micrarchaeota archaeon]
MLNIAVTKMSSKGQVVIPVEFRKDFSEGQSLVLIKLDGQLIVKKASDLYKNLAADLLFAKRTEAALQRYERGLFKERDKDEFLKELEKW